MDTLAMPSARHLAMEETVDEIVTVEMASEMIAIAKSLPSAEKEIPPRSGAMRGKMMTAALKPNVPSHNTADNAHNTTNVMANCETTADLVIGVFISSPLAAGFMVVSALAA